MTAKTLVVVIIFVTNFRMCYTKQVYDNFTLFSVKPTRKEQLNFLQNFALQKYMNVKFWKKPQKLHDEVKLMIEVNEIGLFLERAQYYKLQTTIITDNVQKIFDRQRTSDYQGLLRTETYDWTSFYTLDNIYKWLNDLASKYQREVELESIGKSNEGRDIYALAVRKVEGNKKIVVVEGGAHGTEWISIAFVTYIIHQLLEGENNVDVKLAQIANRYHWYLIPVLNPDGYVYNQQIDRMWRKNRRQIQGNYVGVDLNRNFEYSFGQFDTSTDEKDDLYCGPRAFSEPETSALADLIRRKQTNMKFFFSFQGFGQMFIIPYSDKLKHLENYNEMENYAKQAALKMYRRTGHRYIVGTHYTTTGTQASGDSASWVKKNYKTRYVYTIYLRDNGTYGHGIPPEEILPACREALVGLVELMTVEPKYVKTTMFNQAYPLKEHFVIIIVLCLLTML